MIRYLEWDSDFFEKRIGKVELINIQSIDLVKEKTSDYDLIYIFSDNEIEALNKLVDIKVIYIKKTQKKVKHPNIVEFNSTLHNYEDLLDLAYLSGHDSRFLKDSFFGELAFKKLYKRWIDNSIADIHSSVLVYIEENEILGFVTYSIASEQATIGLIAVSNNAQGKGIGGKLIDEVENFLKTSTRLSVSTQKTNLQACDFYTRKGFVVNNIKYIYHYEPNTI